MVKLKTAPSLEPVYAAAREDLGVFAPLVWRTDKGAPIEALEGSWHAELVDLLIAIERGFVTERAAEILGLEPGAPFTRLNNNCPFGLGKSTWTSAIFPAWYLGRNPDARVGLVMNSSDNAKRFSDAVRTIMMRPAFRAIFPDVRPALRGRGKKWTEAAWNLARPGADSASPSFSAYGRDADVTSKRFDLLILDDAADEKVAQTRHMQVKFSKWARNEAFARVSDSGRILNIGTIRESKDWNCELAAEGWPTVRRPALTAPDMRMATEDQEQETVDEMLARGAELRAVCPEIFSVEGELARRDLLTHGAYEISCQLNVGYLRRTEGKYIKRPMLRYDAAPIPRYGQVGIGIDCAMSSKDEKDALDKTSISFTVATEGWRDRDGALHAPSFIREQIGFLDQVKRVGEMIDRHVDVEREVIVGIERAAGGKQLLEMLEKKYEDEELVIFEDFNPIADKVERATPLIRGMQAGTVRLGAAFQAHEQEMVKFPRADTNDIIDSLAWLARLELDASEPGEVEEDDEDDFPLDDDAASKAAERAASRGVRRDSDDSFADDLARAVNSI